MSNFYIRTFLVLSLLTLLVNGYRLPESIRPSYYRLKVITHLGDDVGYKFKGELWIHINCFEDTNRIVMHSKNLTINTFDVRLSNIVENNLTIETFYDIETDFELENDFFIINTKEKLLKDKQYQIYIPFEGNLSQTLTGYYRSSYFDLKSQKKIWLSVTQFEPTYARQAFPCFDEPSMKAKFEIILGHDKKYQALSNMPIKSSEIFENKPDWVWDHFNETVPMSTYLVAYSINDFEYRESVVKMSEDVIFKIWARRDAINQVDYAKYVGPRILKFYEIYFDEKYPLPKMDMIAIPDFSAGAMENWGLITYRETALLYKPNVSSASSQHRVASVIAHELAHQWFGNLVTMEWWTDLWLNEGFATYVASIGVHYLHPEWNSMTEESVDNTINIFKFDALKTSHPVSVTIGNPSEISQIFDTISYKKGSSVIRMMHLFLGEDSFKYGVSRYLKQHKYGNAEQDDLWASITHEAHSRKSLTNNLTIKEIMDTWTLQTGYPVVTITRDYENQTADVTQTRYLSDTIRLRSDMSNCWSVPLSYTTQIELDFNATQAKDWLKCNPNTSESLPKTIINMPNENQWIIFNIQLAGLYKVKYDQRNWDLLIDTLTGPMFTNINAINRAQLIDDALDLAWTGDQDYNIALRIVKYLIQEREYIPWKTALDNLNSVNRMLRRTPKYGFFKTYMYKVLSPIYEAIGGLNADKVPDRLDAVKHKVLIAAWSCKFGVGDCVEKSKRLFSEWMNMTEPDVENPVPLDLRSVVYCTAIRAGDEHEWEFLWQRYLKSNVGTEKTMILSSLSCTREIWLLSRYLEWSLNSTSGVRKQDCTIVFAGISRGEIGFHLAKSFLIDRVDDIYNYLVPETSRLTRFVKPLADQMMNRKELNELKSLIANNTRLFEKATNGIKQALETVEINTQWQENNYNEISTYLRTFSDEM